MAHLTRPAEISGVSAGSFLETAAGNRAYESPCFEPNAIFQPMSIKQVHTHCAGMNNRSTQMHFTTVRCNRNILKNPS